MIVGAHAGGACEKLDHSADLSSCDRSSEIFQLARALPKGLVDAIAAGRQPRPSGHDGRVVMQVVEEALRSSAEA